MAFEAAYGWGWLAGLLEDYGFDPHLVHPLRCKAIASARLKNDKVDAAILAQLLRAGLLPGAWIAPQPVRQLRAQLRHRASLVRLGTQLRNRIDAVAADFGYDRTGSYWTGPGRGWLAELDLPSVSREIVTDCLASIDALAPVIERLDGELHQHAKADPRVKVLTALPGVGEFTAPVNVVVRWNLPALSAGRAAAVRLSVAGVMRRAQSGAAARTVRYVLLCRASGRRPGPRCTGGRPGSAARRPVGTRRLPARHRRPTARGRPARGAGPRWRSQPGCARHRTWSGAPAASRHIQAIG